MQRPRIVLAVLLLTALLVPAFPTASLAGNPNISCPEPTTLVAKFEWVDGTGYVFEKPDGNEDLVTIDEEDSDQQEGTWESEVDIHFWIIKGSTETFIYPPEHMYAGDPPASGGAFYAEDLGGSEPWTDISNIQFCAPATAITLASFTARPTGTSVILAWETGTEIDNAGFNLYRATAEDGPYAKVNGALIAAEGDTVGGASYSLLDAPGYGTFYYQLEDVDYSGVSTLHGPVQVTVAVPFRRPLRRPYVPR